MDAVNCWFFFIVMIVIPIKFFAEGIVPLWIILLMLFIFVFLIAILMPKRVRKQLR